MDSAVDADLSRQMMQIICYLNYWEGLWEKNSMFLDFWAVCLCIWKLLLIFSNLMSKHYTVPQKTEQIAFWWDCCVFRATNIFLSCLASGEAVNCAASPCVQLLGYQVVIKQHCQRKETRNMGKKEEMQFWEVKPQLIWHFDIWQALSSKWAFKPSPVLAAFVGFQWGFFFFFLYLKLILDVAT